MRFAFMEYKKVGVKRAPTRLNAYFNLHVKIVIGILPINNTFHIEHILKALKV